MKRRMQMQFEVQRINGSVMIRPAPTAASLHTLAERALLERIAVEERPYGVPALPRTVSRLACLMARMEPFRS